MKTLKKSIKKYLSRARFGKNNTIITFETLSLTAQIKSCIFDKWVMVAANAYILNTSVGCYSSIGRYTKITHASIGKFCAISWDCTINALRHPQSNLTISAFPYVPDVGEFVAKREQIYEKVTIGNDVWIGANSVILPGVRVGNGAIIGAGAVVTKDIPDYAIVAGVPGRVIKYRFEEIIINKLLQLKWWNFKENRIRENIDLFKKPLDLDTIEEITRKCRD